MDNEKMKQIAGKDSQQIQGQTINIYNGISESDVRKICSEMTFIAMEKYSVESHFTVEKRIKDFAEILIPRIEKIENGFESFADPEFQLELTKAQVSAACTDKEADYEMLSELLAQRVEKKDNRRIKASISKAVEIVDKIEDDGLCGLTVAYAILRLSPLTGYIKTGLKVLDDMYSKLITISLPVGNSWTSYLDILDVIRVSNVGSFKKLNTIFEELLSGYTVVGIKKDSEDYKKALNILKEVGLNESFLVDHELLDGYVRVPLVKNGRFDGVKNSIIIPGFNVTIPIELVDEQKTALRNICELYDNNPSLMGDVKRRFNELFGNYHNLQIVQEWWDSLHHSFSITPIGEVIAHANAKRYIDIPELSF